jgi:phenylacetate-CoA ligase
MTTPEDILELARHHPVYSLQDVTRFEDAPILTKEHLQSAIRGKESDPLFSRDTYWSPSGGTTTQGLFYFPTDNRENREQRRALARHLKHAGVFGPDHVALNIFSCRSMYRAGEIFNEYCERCECTVLPVTSHASLDNAVRIAQRFGADTVMGGSSRLLALARHLRETRDSLTLKRVVYGGEPLPEPMKEFLKEALGAQTFFGFYGLAETGVLGWSEPDDLDCYYIPREFVYLEIVDGRLVVTNLLRRKHPLLRFDTGDQARLEVQGEFYKVWLGQRHHRSFQIGGVCYELDELRPLVEEMLAHQWVLEHDRTHHRDHLTLRVVGESQGELRDRLLELLGADGDLYGVTVATVKMSELERSERSDKVLPIVDRREVFSVSGG